jgi:hypothetical protein
MRSNAQEMIQKGTRIHGMPDRSVILAAYSYVIDTSTYVDELGCRVVRRPGPAGCLMVLVTRRKLAPEVVTEVVVRLPRIAVSVAVSRTSKCPKRP